MVKVHIWLPNPEHVGHVSLSLTDDYISFWPDEAAGKKDLKTKRSVPGSFQKDFLDDVFSEGNRPPITVELSNLDEAKIRAYIKALRKDLPKYQLARNNCSHVIANALRVGAGCQPSFTPHAGHYGKLGRVLGMGIWTPDQILRFANELRNRSPALEVA